MLYSKRRLWTDVGGFVSKVNDPAITAAAMPINIGFESSCAWLSTEALPFGVVWAGALPFGVVRAGALPFGVVWAGLAVVAAVPTNSVSGPLLLKEVDLRRRWL